MSNSLTSLAAFGLLAVLAGCGGDGAQLEVRSPDVIAEVVDVTLGADWQLTKADGGLSVGPALLNLADGSTLVVPAGTAGDVCFDVFWVAADGLGPLVEAPAGTPAAISAAQADIQSVAIEKWNPERCLLVGQVSEGDNLEWFAFLPFNIDSVNFEVRAPDRATVSISDQLAVELGIGPGGPIRFCEKDGTVDDLDEGMRLVGTLDLRSGWLVDIYEQCRA